MTLAGTEATFESELERLTAAPPGSAGLLNVIVPVEVALLDTVVGLRLIAESAGGPAVTVNVAFLVAPPYVAERVTGVVEATADVVTVNVAEVLPTSTVTLGGTKAAAGTELVSATLAPPAGPPTVSVTVPVEGVPPTTVAGATLSAETAGTTGLTVSVVV